MAGAPICLFVAVWLATAAGKRIRDRVELEEALQLWQGSQQNATARTAIVRTWGQISDWDVTAVTNMSGLFRDWRSFSEDLNSWNTSLVRDMSFMFAGATSFNRPLAKWDTRRVINMSHMFANARGFNSSLNNWNTAAVRDMSCLFCGASSFNRPLQRWITSSVKRMNDMFAFARQFNQNIDSWDTSSVLDMSGMFSYASSFNQSLNSWDTSAVADMSNMFSHAAAFNQPLHLWNTTSVRDMSYMFKMAKAFQRRIGTWDTSAVADMHGMFQYATSFNQPLSQWDTTSVKDMINMFYRAEAFNQPLASWNVSSVSKLSGAFRGAVDFDQSLSTWQLRSLASGQEGLKALLSEARLSSCRALLTWQSWHSATPAGPGMDLHPGSCPSCSSSSACPDDLVCTQGRCLPITAGFLELGTAEWTGTMTGQVGLGFGSCAKLCQTNETCSGFLLRGDGCSFLRGLQMPSKLRERGDAAAFWKVTCRMFPCSGGDVSAASLLAGSVDAATCCDCPGAYLVKDMTKAPELSCFACPAGSTPSADKTRCSPCPSGTYASSGDVLCRACGFPFLLLGDECLWWPWPVTAGSFITLVLAAYTSLRSVSRHRRKRFQARTAQVEAIIARLDVDLWDESPGTADRYAAMLQDLGLSGPEASSRVAERRAARSLRSGVGLRYLLSEHFAQLARDRTAERDPTFHRMKAAFWLEGAPIGADIQCPRDGRLGCALVDWLPPSERREQTHYLSWTWLYSLEELRSSLDTFAGSIRESNQVFFYMCFFVNNHFRAQVDGDVSGGQDPEQAVKPNLRQTGCMLAVLSSWHTPVYFTRLWTIYEQSAALSMGVPVTFVMTPAAMDSLQRYILTDRAAWEDVQDCVGKIDSAGARASDPEDEKRLRSALQEEGGFDSVNTQLSSSFLAWLEKSAQEMLRRENATELVLPDDICITVHEDFVSV